MFKSDPTGGTCASRDSPCGRQAVQFTIQGITKMKLKHGAVAAEEAGLRDGLRHEGDECVGEKMALLAVTVSMMKF